MNHDDKYAVVYLAGAIDLAPDLGAGWRRQMTEFLRSKGCEVADPAQMQASIVGLDVKAMMALRDTDQEGFKEKTRYLIDHDLHFVAKRTTCVVAVVDEHARMGTYAELAAAFLNGVPIFIVCPEKASLSGWALSCADAVFERTQDLIDWLSFDLSADDSLPARLVRRHAERGGRCSRNVEPAQGSNH